MNWKAEYVVTENGKIPFLDFLNTLSVDDKIDILAAIDEILDWKEKNLIIPPSKSKYLRNKIYEMRVRHKNIITRSLFFYFEGKKIVLTHGFIKKTEKTPKAEIEKAEKLRNYYIALKR